MHIFIEQVMTSQVSQEITAIMKTDLIEEAAVGTNQEATDVKDLESDLERKPWRRIGNLLMMRTIRVYRNTDRTGLPASDRENPESLENRGRITLRSSILANSTVLVLLEPAFRNNVSASESG
jgi:hypothetical protein